MAQATASETRVLLFGAGDAGLKTAAMLLARNRLARLAVADKAADATRRDTVALFGDCHGVDAALIGIDGTDAAAVRRLIAAERPHLIVQMASLISPWSIIGRAHESARALQAAGLAVQLPCQLPILVNVMRAVRDLGLDAPVANLSAPDYAHAALAPHDLAPAIGLGNVSIMHLRARAALMRREDKRDEGALPRLRLIGAHAQVYGVMQCSPPADARDAVQVYLGETGERDDALAYQGAAVAAGPAYNVITAGASLPVIEALLPEAAPLNFSAPAPQALIGGYPVRIEAGAVRLDLPPGTDLEEAKGFNARIARADGLERIEADGTVVFTEAAQRAVANLEPRLAGPLALDDLAPRSQMLLEIVSSMDRKVSA